MKTEPDHAAFALHDVSTTASGDMGDGLTKREYFACHILAGFAACPTEIPVEGESREDYQVVQAKGAVEWADALIAALNKPKE